MYWFDRLFIHFIVYSFTYSVFVPVLAVPRLDPYLDSPSNNLMHVINPERSFAPNSPHRAIVYSCWSSDSRNLQPIFVAFDSTNEWWWILIMCVASLEEYYPKCWQTQNAFQTDSIMLTYGFPFFFYLYGLLVIRLPDSLLWNLAKKHSSPTRFAWAISQNRAILS